MFVIFQLLKGKLQLLGKFLKSLKTSGARISFYKVVVASGICGSVLLLVLMAAVLDCRAVKNLLNAHSKVANN